MRRPAANLSRCPGVVSGGSLESPTTGPPPPSTGRVCGHRTLAPSAQSWEDHVVIDLWVNSISKRAAERFLGQKGFGSIEGFFGSEIQGGMTTGDLLGEMDRLGVDRAVLTGTLSSVDAETMDFVADHRDRLLFAATVDDPERPARQSAELRARVADGGVDLVRVTPLLRQFPLNHALYYPVYAACEELGVPVSINVGIPDRRFAPAARTPSSSKTS